jgi:hypothetical protein
VVALKGNELVEVFHILQSGGNVPEEARIILKLSWLDKLKIKIGFPKYVGHYTNNGWSGSLPFYIVWCHYHKIFFIDYPHDYDGHFHCPKCFEEAERAFKAIMSDGKSREIPR